MITPNTLYFEDYHGYVIIDLDIKRFIRLCSTESDEQIRINDDPLVDMGQNKYEHEDEYRTFTIENGTVMSCCDEDDPEDQDEEYHKLLNGLRIDGDLPMPIRYIPKFKKLVKTYNIKIV